MPTRHKVITRDMKFLKPKGYEDYLTITEVSRAVDRDISWIRKLEREKRIPVAHRVQAGQLMVRLWSPAQVNEIKEVLSKMRTGRPPNA